MLQKELVERNIDIAVCAPEVLQLVQDYIDFHTVGAKIEMAAVKLQTWWRKILQRKFQDSWDTTVDPLCYRPNVR